MGVSNGAGNSRAWDDVTARVWGDAIVATAATPAPGTLHTLAVREDGLRAPSAPLAVAACAQGAIRDALGNPNVLIALDHAGPAASAHMEARAVGPAEVESVSGRVPRALNPAGWDEVEGAFVRAADALASAGVVRVLVRADDDGLLACALSPFTNPHEVEEARVERVARIVRAVRRCGLAVGVALTVEEGFPGGLDPTGGVRAARAFVDAGARLLVGGGGTARFDSLHRRPRATGQDDAWLASAGWLVGRVAVPVLGRGPALDRPRASQRALEHGLSGVVAVQARDREASAT